MNTRSIHGIPAKFFTVPILLWMLTPILSFAQTAVPVGDLSATVRAAILKDPRAQSMSSTQIDAMVSALTIQAQAKGLTAQTLAYTPDALVSPQDTSANTNTTDSTSSNIYLIIIGALLGVAAALVAFRRLHHLA